MAAGLSATVTNADQVTVATVMVVPMDAHKNAGPIASPAPASCLVGTNCSLVRAVAAVLGNVAVRFVVRSTQELVIPRVLIQVQLHPGNAEPAQDIIVDTAAVGTIMSATVDLDKAFGVLSGISL